MEEAHLVLPQVNELHILASLYDTIRMLDPVQKKVHYFLKPEGQPGQSAHEACYCFWGKSTACANCASVRALNQNKTIVKIEFKQDKVFMVMSAPLLFHGQRVVIELSKDITDNGIIDIDGKEASEIQNMITEKNRLIIRDALSQIYNQDFIYERLPYNIFQANQQQKSLTLIYLQLTNLTGIIEAEGLDAGDELIRKLAACLQDVCQDPEDWLARHGSAGFLLCLAGTDEKRAALIAGKLEQRFAQLFSARGGERVGANVTVSFHTICQETMTADAFIQLARQGGENLGSPAGEEFFRKYFLTAREKEIAALVLNGQPSKDIAKNLFIGTPTVKKHISAIFEKTGVKSRAELFAKYLQ